MNARRRSGIWLVVLGGLGSIATIGLLAAYTQNVSSQVGERVPVLVLTTDMEPYQPVNEQMVEVRRIPERWAPEARFSSVAQIAGLVAGTPLQEGSFLQRGMLVYPPQVGPRQRRIALAVDAAPVIAGDIARGTEAVIYGTFTSNDPRKESCLTMLVPWARVDRVVEPDAVSSDTATVSVIVHKKYAPRLLYAASFSDEISLVSLGPGALPRRPRSTDCGPRIPGDRKDEERDSASRANRGKEDRRPDGGRRGEKKDHRDRRRG